LSHRAIGPIELITTLTPNPSLDLLFAADRLVWDDANRIPMPRRRPGGQGLNVARAVRALDPAAAVMAIAPLGGTVGAELRQMLEAEGTPLTGVPIDGETRVFVGVRESETGRALLLNPRGPTVTAAEVEALLEAVDHALAGACGSPSGPGSAGAPPGRDGAPWLVASGSLLPGLPADFYARVGRLARSHGARFVPDGDGAALAEAVQGADLLAPNELEAGRLVGRTVDSPAAAFPAARELLGRGPERVVVTLGADGAVAADAGGAWWARPVPPSVAEPALRGASAVGAGDAFLAALLLALDGGVPLPDALGNAVAAGTAVLLSDGAVLLRREDALDVRRWVKVSEEG